MSTSDNLAQKEYLKKYLSGDELKKKKKKKMASTNFKRSQIIDDDIDLKSMRPLDDDEVDLYQMGEDAPQIAGIIDERPVEVKAQEYYNSKRWKVFGGEDGVSVVDNLDKHQSVSDKLSLMSKEFNKEKGDSETLNNKFDPPKSKSDKEKTDGKKDSSDSDISLDRNPVRNKSFKPPVSQKKTVSNNTDEYLKKKNNRSDKNSIQDLSSHRDSKENSMRDNHDSYLSSPRRQNKKEHNYPNSDSDASPPRRHDKKAHRYPKSDSDGSPPRRHNKKTHNHPKSDSDASPPRRESKRKSPIQDHKKSFGGNRYLDSSSPRRDKTKKSKYKNDDYNSPPRKIISDNFRRRNNSDSDISPPRRKPVEERDKDRNSKKSKTKKEKNHHSSSSDNSPPRRERNNTPYSKSTYTRDNKKYSPPRNSSYNRENPPSRLSRRDLLDMKKVKRQYSDSDDSPPRRRKSDSFGHKNIFTRNSSGSDLSPPRKEPLPRKHMKALYKPNDSSSDESKRSKSKKMKTTLDGKQAGLQDAKQLKKELSDLKTKEDAMFSKMDASVSGAGAAPVRRDRKTGQVRDLEREKEVQKEKDAKESVVKEKYYKWGKGIKQVEDAEERAKEVMKEMNKPLARYADDTDLDKLLKAQERDGDPMLDYIRKKQNESTPLTGVKPVYQGAFNPNRFGIRPGHRWDGVVRSSGYEKEWFAQQNARRARNDEAYKWSTSDM